MVQVLSGNGGGGVLNFVRQRRRFSLSPAAAMMSILAAPLRQSIPAAPLSKKYRPYYTWRCFFDACSVGRTSCSCDSCRGRPASRVAHAAGDIIKQFVDAEGYAWRFVSEDTKRLYLVEFQKLFYWDPAIDAQVKKKFYSKAAERYKDWVCKMKAKRFTKGRPQEIFEGAWESWCAYGDLASTQEVTRKAKKNRLADVDGPGSGPSTHRGGSRSAASYAAALAKERGVPIADTLLDTFYKMHRVDGQYTDPKAARIAEEIERITAERSQPLPDGTEPPPVDRNAIYVEVAARADKGRVFGLGSMYTGSGAGSSWGSSPEVGSTPDPKVKAELHATRTETDTLRQEVAELRAKQSESERLAQEAERLAQECARLRSEVAEIRGSRDAETDGLKTLVETLQAELRRNDARQ